MNKERDDGAGINRLLRQLFDYLTLLRQREWNPATEEGAMVFEAVWNSPPQ